MCEDTASNVYPEIYDNPLTLQPNYANPCAGQGHYFTWTGDPYWEIPEGFPCACGQMKAHWGICPTCGNRVLKLIPMEDMGND